ncbi:MAG: shikimate dehydrogenase [Litorimonas sp.]
MTIIPKLAGVCGWPIHHSLSPVLHNYWLRELGIKGAYIPFSTRADEAVSAFKSLKHTTISGVNVTMPLKSQAFEAADDVTDDARKLGVSNCLFKRHGKLIGHNTDLEGFVAPLLSVMPITELTQKSVLIIGAGGASKAVIGALLSLGVPEICLTNRHDKKAQDIVDMVNVPSLYSLAWDRRHEGVARSSLIVNASAGGMSGKAALDISLDMAPDRCGVYDLIYTPMMTPLLKGAQKRGLLTIGGLDMLIAQARPSFKLFFGEDAPAECGVRDVLLGALKSGAR